MIYRAINLGVNDQEAKGKKDIFHKSSFPISVAIVGNGNLFDTIGGLLLPERQSKTADTLC